MGGVVLQRLLHGDRDAQDGRAGALLGPGQAAVLDDQGAGGQARIVSERAASNMAKSSRETAQSRTVPIPVAA